MNGVYMGEISRLLPKFTYRDEENFLKNIQYAETQDSLYILLFCEPSRLIN
jgi:hypothetical protein